MKTGTLPSAYAAANPRSNIPSFPISTCDWLRQCAVVENTFPHTITTTLLLGMCTLLLSIYVPLQDGAFASEVPQVPSVAAVVTTADTPSAATSVALAAQHEAQPPAGSCSAEADFAAAAGKPRCNHQPVDQANGCSGGGRTDCRLKV